MAYVNGMLACFVRDPEMRTTTTGKTMCYFKVANNYGYGDNKKVDYVQCVAFGKTGESIARFFKKGDWVILEGEMHDNTFKKERAANGREYNVPNWEYQVTSFHFIPKQKQSERDDSKYAPIEPAPAKNNQYETIDVDDDVLF